MGIAFFILGILKARLPVPEEIRRRQALIVNCAYSAITRMELLGYPGITREEETVSRQKLARLNYLPLTRSIEDVAISLRKTRRSKLPDAIIVATAATPASNS